MDDLKIACISDYPPRMCGIATFTHDLVTAVSGSGVEHFIVALNDPGQTYDYPEEVRYTVRQEDQRDYLQAARYINLSEANVCLLQHEFGIYGGDSGIYVLNLIGRLEKPLVVTLHTILKEPTANQKTILQEIGQKAERLVVMSRMAVDFLADIYGVPREKIALVEHGVPDLTSQDRIREKKKHGLEKRKSILTFGLLSRSKGIETVIKALPKVVEKHPEVLYVVLGKTHPHVVKKVGEEYRNYLQLLVEKLDLKDHVIFLNRFVAAEELYSFLAAIDIHITPYLNEAQITSGTLSYAVGAGAAVISTPYWHAKELLMDGRGKLFPFGDARALSRIRVELLDQPAELATLRNRAHAYGRRVIWPEIGKRYGKILADAVESPICHRRLFECPFDPLILPTFQLAHICRLTDDTGIVQHAHYIVPRRKTGYALDDNARALLVSLMAYKQTKAPEALTRIPVYLSFIEYMQKKDGSFWNFLSYDRRYVDGEETEDAFGRAVWAIGYLHRFAPNVAYQNQPQGIFDRARRRFPELSSLRGVANTMIGMSHMLHSSTHDGTLRDELSRMADFLIHQYNDNRADDWKWFESIVTYDNGILPLSLLHAYEILKEPVLLDTAVESLSFLDRLVFPDAHLSLVGNDGWHQKDKECARFAQQPIDAMALVLLYHQAFVVTGDSSYLRRMFKSYFWFLGDNDLGIPLYDFDTGGCGDGLEREGVSLNQGAESTICYLLAHLTVLLAYEYVAIYGPTRASNSLSSDTEANPEA